MKFSYQALVLLLLSTAHHLREVDQRSSHVVTLGLLVHILVLDLNDPGLKSYVYMLEENLSLSIFLLLHTHITGDVPALLARDEWDVFMVQLVASSFRVVPLLFVEFLESYEAATKFKCCPMIETEAYCKRIFFNTSLMILETSLLWAS